MKRKDKWKELDPALDKQEFLRPYYTIREEGDWEDGLNQAIDKTKDRFFLTEEQDSRVEKLREFVLDNPEKFISKNRIGIASAIVLYGVEKKLDGEDNVKKDTLKKDTYRKLPSCQATTRKTLKLIKEENSDLQVENRN